MKFGVTLLTVLLANWLLWSGHFDNGFLILLGIGSCVISLWLAWRMRIVDDEGTPVQLGLIGPFLWYAPWLAKEIVVSNIQVAKIILSPVMPLRRNIVHIPADQKTEIGRVILANSITLTPGTVSIHLQDKEVLVHGLSVHGTAEDMSGDMGRRICRLEGSEDASKDPKDAHSPTDPS